ncbi:MAG: hypothetical protein ABSA01_13585 [Anaerolineales bacterium]|jgi:hypothetical protein
MLTIHDNGLKIDNGKFRYAWYKVSESPPQGHMGGTPYYCCVALKQMDIIPVTERQDFDLLGKMWRAMRGIYNANVNFVAANAGIFSPEHIGLVQYFGAAGEGPVAKQWTHSEDVYLRLAVYDQHTRVTKEKGNYGRPRRLPHYLTIVLPGGKTTGGREVVANVKDRLRVTGELHDHGYRRTLHEMLLGTGSTAVTDLLQRLPNAGDLHTISAQQESLHVVASAVIVYASAGSRHEEQD